MRTAKKETPKIIVVGSGPPKRPAEQIIAAPMKIPKWLPIGSRKAYRSP